MYINGSIGVILLGVAVGSFFSGSQFSVDSNNFSHWQTPWRGLELVFNMVNISLGMALFFLSRIGGALYFANNIDNETIRKRAFKSLWVNAPLFLLFFLGFLAQILLKSGFAYGKDGEVFMQPYKYLLNFLDMPVVFGAFILGVILVLISLYMGLIKKATCSIFPFGVGVVLVVFNLLLVVGFNNTAYYPSTYDLQSSLTIENSSSSRYTLVAMSYASLLVPFVLAYIVYVWYSMDRVKITKEEMDSSDENY